jgi:hypothetical protein
MSHISHDQRRGGRTLAALLAVAGLVAATSELPAAELGSRAETIADAPSYFPDAIGSRWRYRGRIEEWPLQKVSTAKGYVNVSTVTGTRTIGNVTVKVFHDTNPGNRGPTDSYYRRDAAGVVYYGSSPGTPIEQQVIPYQIARFPLEVPSSFQQFDRKGIDFGGDLDGDGTPEKADVEASVTVTGREDVVVPAGSYPKALRMEARMTMRVYLSKSKRVVLNTDVLTAWFARGVGLVKYVEHQELPPAATDKGIITDLSEELEEADVKAAAVSPGGRTRAAAYSR